MDLDCSILEFDVRPLSWLLLFVVVGCSSVNVTPYRELAFEPTGDVEVLRSEPDRPYLALAEMWVSSNDSDGVLKMRQEAMEIGADAIVLIGERNAGAVAIPLQGPSGGAVALPVNRTYALAIRYER